MAYSDEDDNLYKILGAVALTGQEGAVDRIDPSVLKQGDACFCIASSGYYIFRAYESSAVPTTLPFTEYNPPLVIQPNTELFGNTTTFRWHLVSSNAFVSDLKILAGKKIIVGKVQGDPNISFYDGSGNKVAEVKQDGTFWVSKLETSSTELVANLNAELFGGHTEDEIILRDGSRRFTNPIAGVNPTLPDHLSTKNYVDEKVQILQPELYIRRDGSTSFENPVSGLDPTLPDHLATKQYVDNTLDATINKLFEMQRFIIYKTGTTTIPVGARRLTIKFGGNLSRYSVFATVVNVNESNPASTTAVISEQYSDYFTADFGGIIPSANYKLNWLIVGIPEGYEEYKNGQGSSDSDDSTTIVGSNNVKMVLQENTNVYVSGGTGNDSNDGLTQFSPKKTIAGLLSLLNSIDTNGYKVKVLLVSPFEEIESLWFLPGYSPENLEILPGTAKYVIDAPANIIIASGGCTFTKMNFKTVEILDNASVVCHNCSAHPTNNVPCFRVSGNLKLSGKFTVKESTSTIIQVTNNKTILSETVIKGSSSKISVETIANIDSASVYFNGVSTESITAECTAIIKNGAQVSGITKEIAGEGKVKSSNLAYSATVPTDWKHALQHNFENGIDPISYKDVGALGKDETSKLTERWKNNLNVKLTGSVTGNVEFNGSEENVELATVLNTNDPLLSDFSQHVTKTWAHEATPNIEPERIVIRDGQGRAKFNEGVEANDVVTVSQIEKIKKSIDSKELNILNQLLTQIQGVGNNSLWAQIGNLLICWGNCIFYNGSAEVTLPKSYTNTNYFVTFTATNSSGASETTFTLNKKQNKVFNVSCTPAEYEEQHSFLTIGLIG